MKLLHINGPWPLCTNTFLIITEGGHGIAIDPAADPARYLDPLKEAGATLSHIFLTHGHYDHVGTVAALKQQTGAKVMMDPADAQGTQMFPLTKGLVDEVWPESGTVTVDELTFRVWHTPGHSQGSVCLACGGYLFSGDTLFAMSCGRVDLPGGDPEQMRRSLSMVANLPLPDETQVLPGHESFSTLGKERRSNPYLLGEWY